MRRIKRVMVACDMSENAKQSLKYGRELAENLKAALLVVNVVNQRDVVAMKEALAQMEIFSKSSGIRMDDYVEKVKRERSVLLQKLLEETSCDHLEVKKSSKSAFRSKRSSKPSGRKMRTYWSWAPGDAAT